jgi:hypothetical protein
MQTNPIELIANQIRQAIAGDSLPDVDSAELAEYVAAVHMLLRSEESPVKDAALNVVALAALAGLNDRLRASALVSRAIKRGPLQ